MRILYIDCDSLRPDHLGCYGYHRDTSPNIDRLAADGLRFDGVYTSDAPCLPSRTALLTGRFGFHTGVVNHGGLTADPRPLGRERGFNTRGAFRSLPQSLRDAGLHTAFVSPFPSRHGAWHVLDGYDEWYDTGKDGLERADEVYPHVESWLREHAIEDDWFLHVNFWDPHIPYDAPPSYGDPFADDPAPPWPPEDVIEDHYRSYGPHSAHDLLDFGDNPETPREPSEIATRDDFERYVNGYDVGIHYMDSYVGRLIDLLEAEGVREETLLVLSADHGENLGELNVYGDHQTADDKTCNVPLVMCGLGVEPGVDEEFHYHLDLAPTLAELAGAAPAPRWDGESFATTVTDGTPAGRDALVVSQGAHVAQRGVRWGDWLLVRTYHDGVKDFPPVMLFDLASDPHEAVDRSGDREDVVAEGMRLLERWHSDRMDEATRGYNGGNPATPRGIVDPLREVVRDGGPFHATGTADIGAYVERLRETGREDAAERVERQYLSDDSTAE